MSEWHVDMNYDVFSGIVKNAPNVSRDDIQLKRACASDKTQHFVHLISDWYFGGKGTIVWRIYYVNSGVIDAVSRSWLW